MNTQDTFRAGNDNPMARWLASGGAALDDGLRAGGMSGHPVFCAEEGLLAGRMTTHPFACAEDGLRCSNITQGYGCIPPQADDGLIAGNTTHGGCGI